MKSAVAVALAPCVFLIASPEGVAVPSLRESFRLCGNFFGNPKWLLLKSPSWWSEFGTKRKIVGRLGQVFSLKHCSTHVLLGFASPSSPLSHPRRSLSERTS